MTRLKEYDLAIKPVHTIKGHGLYRLSPKGVDVQEEEEDIANSEQEIEIEMYNVE